MALLGSAAFPSIIRWAEDYDLFILGCRSHGRGSGARRLGAYGQDSTLAGWVSQIFGCWSPSTSTTVNSCQCGGASLRGRIARPTRVPPALRDDEQPRQPRDRRRDLLDHAIDEILLRGIAGHVLKGQDRQRRLVRERQRSSDRQRRAGRCAERDTISDAPAW